MSNVENPDNGEASVNALVAGANQPLRTSAGVGIKADSKAVTKLKNDFSSLHQVLKDIRKEMEAISTASRGIKAPGGTSSLAGTGAAGTPMAGAPFKAAEVDQGAGAVAGEVATAGAARGVPTTTLGKTAMAGTQILSAGIQVMDARIERGRDYSLSADRMSLVYQQMYGMSQNQVANQYRTPMSNMLLGPGGINELMSMQATTGISALQQASSVAAMRVMTGFSLSSGQITDMISQMAQPDVNNRLFIMGGTGLIGPGGRQRDMMQVIQDITRNAGLTDPRLARSAMTPGSITRANLTMMGVTGEMQDMVLQYAQQNLTYRQKGGRGMYDPNSKEAQKIMGIEDNFALEAEKTDAARVSREEQFYKRQADNFADMEKQTQKLTKAMAGLENVLSGIIGVGIGSKGARQIGGTVGTLIGGAIGASTGNPAGVLFGAMFGNMAGNFVGSMFTGDGTGTGESGGGNVTIGYGGKSVPRSEVESSSTFSNLHPTFKSRLLKMIADNPNVGIGEGFRTGAQQERMFRDRYEPTNEKTKVYWNGSYWKKKNPNAAGVAAPGRSMHEIGLAADLVGDVDWAVKNAHKYGLKTYESAGEPWHIQPADLPGARVDYEQAGAPWGTMGQPIVSPETGPDGTTAASGVSTPEGSTAPSGSPSESVASASGISSAALLTGQLSIQDKIALTTAFVRGTRTPRGASGSTKGTSGASPSGSGSSSTNSTPALGGGALSGEEVAKLLYAAGFRGKDLADMLAISWRESNWNPSAYNPIPPDLSYGLFQHNMIPGATDPEGNRRDWGISKNEDLFDPATNVRIAYEKYKWNIAHGYDKFYGWEINGNPLAKTEGIYAEATRIANEISQQGGDPVPSGGSPSSPVSHQSTSVTGNHTFNIAPNIVINGSASNDDIQRMAKAVTRMLEREVRASNLRSF